MWFSVLMATVWLCLRAGIRWNKVFGMAPAKAIAAFQGKFTKQELEKQL
jgi:hypothetical protein